MPNLGPAGRGGARRRTRRRQTAMHASAPIEHHASAPIESQASNTSTDPTSLLQMLQTLHNAGVLTDAEYDKKKRQVVDKM